MFEYGKFVVTFSLCLVLSSFLSLAEAASPCVKHPFVSARPDSSDATLIRPSDWNACHTIEDGAIGASKLDFDPATQTELDAHINDTTAAHAASAISFTPNGSISATTVQAAIQEVRDEAGGGSGTVTSVGLAGTANQITVTGSTPITASGSWTLSIPSSPTLPGTTTGTFSGNLTGAVTGNASTASALAANGSNCSAGQFPLGVDASGAVESCTALPTTITGTANQITASGSTGAITLSIPTSPTLPGTTTGTFSGNLTGNVTGNVTGTSGSTTGNAATATALAANGANCSAGSYPLGVDASGAVEGCTAVGSGISGLTTGTIPKAASSTTLGNSILTESGTTITAAGSLTAGGFNSLTMAPSTTGNPVTLTATGSDADVGIKLISKGDGAVIISHGEAIHADNTAGIATNFGVVIRNDMDFDFALGAVHDAVGSVNQQLTYWAAYNAGLGTVGLAKAAYVDIENYGGGHIGEAMSFYQFFAQVGGTWDKLTGTYFWLSENTGTIDEVRGHYIKAPNPPGTINKWFGLWSDDLTSVATNPYYLWLNGPARRRIRQEVDGNIIDAWYNKDFSPLYEPGGADYERFFVANWDGSNVAEFGTQAGGLGTLRPVRWRASQYKLAALTSNGFVKTSGGDGTLSVDTASYQTALTDSASLRTALSDENGTGAALFSGATSAVFVTPVLGVAAATSINKVAITAPATSATLTILDGKTLTANHSLTLAGTDSTTMTFPTTSATMARTDAAQTFTGVQTFGVKTIITNNALFTAGNHSLQASGNSTAGIDIYSGVDFHAATSNVFDFYINAVRHLRVGLTDLIIGTGAAASVHFGTGTILNMPGNNILEQVRTTNPQTFRVYGTFTDTSNYERASLKHTTGTGVTLAAETAGTGGDNLDVILTPAGTGNVSLPGGVLFKTAAALTDGAGASTATLLNSPAVGNPTKWIPINDNGTTRYLPAW